jgi:hypothetical protein
VAEQALAGFVRRWVEQRWADLRAGQPQDVAVSEVFEAMPELSGADPLTVGLHLLQVAMSLDVAPAELALVVDLGDAPGGLEAPQPPGEWALRPEPRQVQLHVTPPAAGSDRPVDVRSVELPWGRPTGFDRPLAMTYTVARPVGPEFDDWEPAAAVTIRPV